MLDFNIPQVKNKFSTDALTFLYLKSKPECKNMQQMGHFSHQTILFYIDSEYLFFFSYLGFLLYTQWGKEV